MWYYKVFKRWQLGFWSQVNLVVKRNSIVQFARAYIQELCDLHILRFRKVWPMRGERMAKKRRTPFQVLSAPFRHKSFCPP